MREILFRGKRLDNGEWVEGSLHVEWGETRKDGSRNKDYRILGVRGECYYVAPDTVGQYIGFCDRNGQKIFEGDIVEDGRDYNEEDGYGVVEWNDGAFEVISEGNWSGTFYTNYYGYEFKVIGNIHDNPDLLKGE